MTEKRLNVKIKNHKTKEFIEFQKKEINIYLCGPTVYDDIHIGNARTIIIFDILNRFLKHSGYKVKYILNITDIDDKIINSALKQNIDESKLADNYYSNFKDILNKLNILPPTQMPKVTDNIETIISFIEKLIQKKLAYTKNGSVYFDISTHKNYGEISSNTLENMKLESNNKDKKNQADFVLWKKTTEGLNFNSPWSFGRPGWHTECSAIIDDIFKGKTIDIKGGGIDLKFPHHENEQAQYKTCNGVDLANVFMYLGHVTVLDTKMSKSLNNSIYVKDFINKYSADTLRYIFMTTSYQKPINFSDNLANNAQIKIEKYHQIISDNIDNYNSDKIDDDIFCKIEFELSKNLNLPNVISLLELLVKKSKKEKDEHKYVNTLIKTFNLLGFNFIDD